MYLTHGNFPTYHKLLVKWTTYTEVCPCKVLQRGVLNMRAYSTISLKQTADNMNRIFHGRKGFLQVRTSSLFLLFILSEQNKKLKKMFN